MVAGRINDSRLPILNNLHDEAGVRKPL